MPCWHVCGFSKKKTNTPLQHPVLNYKQTAVTHNTFTNKPHHLRSFSNDWQSGVSTAEAEHVTTAMLSAAEMNCLTGQVHICPVKHELIIKPFLQKNKSANAQLHSSKKPHAHTLWWLTTTNWFFIWCVKCLLSPSIMSQNNYKIKLCLENPAYFCCCCFVIIVIIIIIIMLSSPSMVACLRNL